MSEIVYYGTVSDIEPIIQTFPADVKTFMILERIPTGWIDFNYYDPHSGLKFTQFNDDENFNEWGRGRIFNQRAELRWEQTKAGFQMVYVGASVEMPDLIADDTINLTNTEKKEGDSYYLWGQRMSKEQLEDMRWDPTATNVFVELQTPRVLRYPVQAKVRGRLKLQVVEYFEPNTGQLLAYRFQGVEAV